MSEWRTIDSAPKDGMIVLAITKYGKFYLIRWSQRQFDRFGNGWAFAGDGFINPTHWMPLPPPPTPEPNHE